MIHRCLLLDASMVNTFVCEWESERGDEGVTESGQVLTLIAIGQRNWNTWRLLIKQLGTGTLSLSLCVCVHQLVAYLMAPTAAGAGAATQPLLTPDTQSTAHARQISITSRSQLPVATLPLPLFLPSENAHQLWQRKSTMWLPHATCLPNIHSNNLYGMLSLSLLSRCDSLCFYPLTSSYPASNANGKCV